MKQTVLQLKQKVRAVVFEPGPAGRGLDREEREEQ